MDDKLPHGRHGLTRSEVEAHQRARIEQSVLEAAHEHGLGAVKVRHITTLAGVSRETFYGLYFGVDQCFDASLAEFARQLDHVGCEEAAAVDSFERFDDALRRVLAVIAADPLRSTCYLFESTTRSGARVGRPTALRSPFTLALTRLLGDGSEPLADALLAMTRQLVEERLRSGDAAGVPDLVDLVSTALRSFPRHPPVTT